MLLTIISFLILTETEGQKWVQIESKNGAVLYTRAVSGSNIKEFKVEFEVEENIQTIVNMLKDVSNMHLWYDKIKIAKTLKEINDHSGIYHLEFSIPFPFTNRWTTVKGEYAISNDKKTAHFSSKYEPYTSTINHDGLTHVTSLKSSWEITAVSPKKCKVTHIAFMDPSGNIPTWAINDGVEKGPFRTVEGMKKLLTRYR